MSERVDKYCQKSGAAAASESQEVLADRDISAVLVLTETCINDDLIKGALEAGKHLFAEKPVTLNPDTIGITARDVAERDLLFQTGFHMRYDSGLDVIPPDWQHLEVQFGHQGLKRGWFADEFSWMANQLRAGFGGFGDLGVHCIDLICHLSGSLPEKVSVACQTDRKDLDLGGSAKIVLSDGREAVFSCGWNMESVLKLRINNKEILPVSSCPVDALHEFLRGIQGDPVRLVSFDEALQASRLIQDMLRQAEKVLDPGLERGKIRENPLSP